MDFSRWSIPSLYRVRARARGFREFLAEVLEGERGLIASEKETRDEAPSFTRFDDISLLEADLQKLAVRGHADVARVFAAVSLYYDAGFCLRRVGRELKIESMFLFGRVFTPAPSEAVSVDFGLAGRGPISGVWLGKVEPVLREARLEGVAALRAADALAFEVSSERVFVLISDRPHPWQVPAIEATYLKVRDVLAQSGAVRPAPQRKFFR